MNKLNVLAVMKDIYVKHKNKALAILAGVLVPAAFVVAQSQGLLASAGTTINCMVAGSCNIVLAAPETPLVTEDKGLFGASTRSDEVTRWISGEFTDDLLVSGELDVTGTSTFSGATSGVPKSYSATFSTAATTTACTTLNSSGVTRTIIAASVVDRGTASSLGTIAWRAGTSTASGANGASTPTFLNSVDSVLTRVSGADNITTTSTYMATSTNAGYGLWRSGEYFNFISSTTTNAGTCRILFY